MQLIVLLGQFLLARSKEASTYAGLAGVLVALAPLFPQYADLLYAVAAVLGGGAVVKPDGRVPRQPDA